MNDEDCFLFTALFGSTGGKLDPGRKVRDFKENYCCARKQGKGP
jgi:hypothetical protein